MTTSLVNEHEPTEPASPLPATPQVVSPGLDYTDTRPLRIGVVSDISFISQALAAVLEREPLVSMVGLYADLAEAVAQSAALGTDAIVMDAALPNGANALRRIRDTAPDLPIIVYGVRETSKDVIAWAEAGATGYLPTSTPLDRFASLILDIYRGDQPSPAPVVAGLIRRLAATAIFGYYPRSAEAPPLFLTRRERQVAELIIGGHTDKEIAGRLGITLATTKSHVHTLLGKLEVRRRREVADRLARPMEHSA
jgi:DNA-binding NarL/FixJ family response regulator